MGSFTKNFRKRLMRTKLANSTKLNQYLIHRVGELAAQIKPEPTIEQINQQRMDLIRSVMPQPVPVNPCTAVEVYKGGTV